MLQVFRYPTPDRQILTRKPPCRVPKTDILLNDLAEIHRCLDWQISVINLEPL